MNSGRRSRRIEFRSRASLGRIYVQSMFQGFGKKTPAIVSVGCPEAAEVCCVHSGMPLSPGISFCIEYTVFAKWARAHILRSV